jgi:hypothetical protein
LRLLGTRLLWRQRGAGLELKIEVEGSWGYCGLPLNRLEAEHCDRKTAGVFCGKTADLKTTGGVGYGGNPIRAAECRDGGARNRLATGTYNASLYVRGGNSDKHENQTR